LQTTLACYVGNNATLSTGNRGQDNCHSGECNVGPLWIQRSDESRQQAAYYCSVNLGLQVGHVYRRTTLQTSSPVSLVTDHLPYTKTQSITGDHPGHWHSTTQRPTSTSNDKNSNVDYMKRRKMISRINQWSSASLPSDVVKRRPKFGSHARVPGTVPSNSTLE